MIVVKILRKLCLPKKTDNNSVKCHYTITRIQLTDYYIFVLGVCRAMQWCSMSHRHSVTLRLGL